MSEHHKHPPLARPSIGSYHRNEWAIYGTTCSRIEELQSLIADGLKEKFNSAYIDAHHGAPISGNFLQSEERKIHSPISIPDNVHRWRPLLESADVVFINGNHYAASRQIVVLDEKKKDSLKRRAPQLSRIDFVLKTEEVQNLYDFLEELVDEHTVILEAHQTHTLISLLRSNLEERIPPVKALVLAGGKSQRMGHDKSQISYKEGLSQEVYLTRICQGFGMEAYISKAHDHDTEEIAGIPVIKDRLLDMGPFGAIISAMMSDPDSAWMVLACDLPYLDRGSLSRLIEERDPSKFATTYKSKHKAFAEPLITIYEPRSYSAFLEMLTQGYSCPRKVIINTDVKVIELPDDLIIENVNTPEELAAVKERLHG